MRATSSPLLSPIGLGLVAGLISGTFGVGGGIIVVPGLVFFLHYTQRLSHGTSLLAILPIAVSGVIGYTLHGSIALGYAAFLGLGRIAGALIGTKLLGIAGVPTAFIGAQLAIIMSAQVSMILFAGLLVLSAVQLLRSSKQGECNI